MAAHRRSADLLASYGRHPSRAFQSEGWPATRSSRVASNSPPSLAPIYSRAMVGTLRVHTRAKGGLPPEALELRRTAHRRSHRSTRELWWAPFACIPERRVERETGFEPATSTLARSHSTTELFPPERSTYHTARLAFKL